MSFYGVGGIRRWNVCRSFGQRKNPRKIAIKSYIVVYSWCGARRLPPDAIYVHARILLLTKNAAATVIHAGKWAISIKTIILFCLPETFRYRKFVRGSFLCTIRNVRVYSVYSFCTIVYKENNWYYLYILRWVWSVTKKWCVTFVIQDRVVKILLLFICALFRIYCLGEHNACMERERKKILTWILKMKINF